MNTAQSPETAPPGPYLGDESHRSSRAVYRDSLYRESLYRESLYRDSVYRESLYSESLYRDSLYRDSLYRDSQYKESLYQDSLYRDSLYSESLYRDSLYRDSLYRDSLYRESAPLQWNPTCHLGGRGSKSMNLSLIHSRLWFCLLPRTAKHLVALTLFFHREMQNPFCEWGS